MNYSVTLIHQQTEFDRVMQELSEGPWIGFDTEFVGERTYIPKLCLIQIVADNDIYLVDTLQVSNLDRFLDIIRDPQVLKITHAGDNDYRLLYTLYGIVPKNTFDTQISAGFVGYNYPAGFGRIVEKEVRVTLAKSHTVADWEARPLDPKAVDYAIEDVKYLPTLYTKLMGKLQRAGRDSWAREENRKWESEGFYAIDPFKEVLGNEFIHQLDTNSKVFLIRLYRWRREKAAALNIPKESVLQSRHISTVVRASKDTFRSGSSNRTMSDNIWKRYIAEWTALKTPEPTEAETAFINQLPRPVPDDPEREWTMELLYQFVRYQCLQHEISPALLLPRGDFNKLKNGEADFNNGLLTGWRAEMLGNALVGWLQHNGRISMEWSDQSCLLHYQT
jgi:ribonuclease D